MDRSEEQFFEMYDTVQAYLDTHPDLRFEQLMSVRQVWDLAYSAGKADGANEVLAIVKGDN